MYEKTCPVVETLKMISGKWKVLILYNLQNGPLHFNELQRTMPQISQRMLTMQLRGLEADGIIRRKVYPTKPPGVEYSLTDFGQTLCPVISAMDVWWREHGSLGK